MWPSLYHWWWAWNIHSKTFTSVPSHGVCWFVCFNFFERNDFSNLLLLVLINKCWHSNVDHNRLYVHHRYMIWIDMKCIVQMNWTLVRLLDRDFMGLHERYVERDLISSRLNCVLLCLQVTLRKTGQIMVMKETKTFDKEAQKIFVKEVRFLSKALIRNISSNSLLRFKFSND